MRIDNIEVMWILGIKSIIYTIILVWAVIIKIFVLVVQVVYIPIHYIFVLTGKTKRKQIEKKNQGSRRLTLFVTITRQIEWERFVLWSVKFFWPRDDKESKLLKVHKKMY